MTCNALGALLAEEFNEQAFVWLGYAPARVVGWRANAPGDEKAAESIHMNAKNKKKGVAKSK